MHLEESGQSLEHWLSLQSLWCTGQDPRVSSTASRDPPAPHSATWNPWAGGSLAAQCLWHPQDCISVFSTSLRPLKIPSAPSCFRSLSYALPWWSPAFSCPCTPSPQLSGELSTAGVCQRMTLGWFLTFPHQWWPWCLVRPGEAVTERSVRSVAGGSSFPLTSLIPPGCYWADKKRNSRWLICCCSNSSCGR